MQPNKVLSKTMHVKQLAPGEPAAIYRLIAADQKSAMVTDEKGNPINNNPAKSLAKQTLVRDIETGMKVMIGNVTSIKYRKDKDGNDVPVEVTSPPKFVRGNMRVTQDDFATMQYMERHDGNQDNPFRDKKKMPVYYRVNPKKKAMEETHQLSMLGEAIMWVSACDLMEIKAINSKLPDGMKLNMNNDFEIIKMELLKKTKDNPIEVMKASSNRAALIKVHIMEAENFNIIMWDEESRNWFYNDAEQETITTIEIGTDRVNGMVDYFRTEEGKKLYMRMAGKLKKFLNMGSPN